MLRSQATGDTAKLLTYRWFGMHGSIHAGQLAPVLPSVWTVGFVKKLVGELDVVLSEEGSVGCHWLRVLRSQATADTAKGVTDMVHNRFEVWLGYVP